MHKKFISGGLDDVRINRQEKMKRDSVKEKDCKELEGAWGRGEWHYLGE